MKRDNMVPFIVFIIASLIFMVGYATGRDAGERWGIALRDEFLKQRNVVEAEPNRAGVIWIMRHGDKVATCFRDDEAGSAQAMIFLLSGRRK